MSSTAQATRRAANRLGIDGCGSSTNPPFSIDEQLLGRVAEFIVAMRYLSPT